MPTPNIAALRAHGSHNFLFHLLLRGPALFICRRPQITASNQHHSIIHKPSILTRKWGRFPTCPLENFESRIPLTSHELLSPTPPTLATGRSIDLPNLALTRFPTTH